MGSIRSIHGSVQDYAWGGYQYIPQLLGYDNPNRAAQAEYWLGTHPAAQTLLDNGESLGSFLHQQSLRLNFLLKVLDVRDMLSIQVHPNKKQAENGFIKENQLGVPLQAKSRNFKDDNHKPELMVALSDFWLLHGFRHKSDIMAQLRQHDFLHPIADHLADSDIKTAFAAILDDRNEHTVQAQSNLKAHFANTKPPCDKHDPDFWVSRWLERNSDVLSGLLAIYFLNLCYIPPGKAVYQPAGLLHAYLEGQNIELMANSDNVLRAGLTPKHIDTAALLDIANFNATDPSEFVAQRQACQRGWSEFATPFDEFCLAQLHTAEHRECHWTAKSCEIVLCIAGQGKLSQSPSDSQPLGPGQAYLITPETAVELTLNSDDAVIFKAYNRVG